MSFLLRLEGVGACYGKKQVLKDISLSIPKGKILVLIGPNGSGKTTLSRVICRSMKPSAGALYWEGKDLRRVPFRDYARQTACLQQKEKTVWSFTVEEVVFMGRFPHRRLRPGYSREDREQVEKALRTTGLEDLRNQRIDQISGGEAQRAFLARTMAQNPRLLVLDEPAAHLDLQHRLALMDTVRDFTLQGLTVVVCLHDLALTALYADKVALLEKGRIIKQGSPREVLTKKELERSFQASIQVDTFPGTDRLKIMAVPSWVEKAEKGEAPGKGLTPPPNPGEPPHPQSPPPASSAPSSHPRR